MRLTPGWLGTFRSLPRSSLAGWYAIPVSYKVTADAWQTGQGGAASRHPEAAGRGYRSGAKGRACLQIVR